MAVRHFNLTITAAAQPLSTAIATDPARGGTRDEAMREIILSCETDCFIGATNTPATLTTSVYGYKLLSAGTQPLYIGPYDAGPVKLSELSVIGTSGVLHILAIPY